MNHFQVFKEDIVWHQLVVYMMSFFILADMLAGFSVIYIGIDLKVSLLYKMPIFILSIILIGKYNVKWMLLIISSIFIFFIGPFYQFTQHVRVDFLFNDFALLLKMVTPVVIFIYFRILFEVAPDFALKSAERVLWCSFILLIINFVLGGLGFGKSTYQLGDDEGAGSTGLMMAGNELGAAFLVVFGFVLHKTWTNRGSLVYLLVALLTVISGVSISTKTAMLAGILLVFFIPIVNERERLYKITMLKIKLLLPLIAVTSVIVYLIFDILEKIGLLDRAMWFYQKKGLVGIILSGRNDMIADRGELVLNHSNLFEQLFGQGLALGLKDVRGYAGVEVDSVDIFNLYGILPLLLFSSFYLWGVYKAHNHTITNHSPIAPYVFIVSFLLLCLSQLSGHIWTSSTLGILFGCMFSLLFYKDPKASTNDM